MTNDAIAEPVLAEVVVADDTLLPHGQGCEACGAPIESEDRFCTACGRAVADQSDPGEPVEAEAVPRQYFRCKNCGSEVATDPDQRSYTCAFCDSTYVVEYSPQETGRQAPEFIIGFRITPEQARDKFRSWLCANSWFRPGDLKMAKIAEKLRGIYMPFWSFSTLVRSSWSAAIGEYWYRTETYTTMKNGKMVTSTRRVQETEWWNLSGRHHQYHSGYLVSGSNGLPQSEAERIKPFQLPALKRYQPSFLAGWVCEEYSLDREDAWEPCKQEFDRREQSSIATMLPGDTHRSLAVNSTFSDTNSDLILLPVYLLSYRYGDQLYRFMINGQTGKVAGDKPISRKRIAVATAVGVTILLVIIGVILLLV